MLQLINEIEVAQGPAVIGTFHAKAMEVGVTRTETHGPKNELRFQTENQVGHVEALADFADIPLTGIRTTVPPFLNTVCRQGLSAVVAEKQLFQWIKCEIIIIIIIIISIIGKQPFQGAWLRPVS